MNALNQDAVVAAPGQVSDALCELLPEQVAAVSGGMIRLPSIPRDPLPPFFPEVPHVPPPAPWPCFPFPKWSVAVA